MIQPANLRERKVMKARHLPLLAALLLSMAANAQEVDIAQQPVFLNPPDPRIMLLVSRDHELSKKAYNDYSDLDGDGQLETTYTDTIDYYGYFNPRRCYTYRNDRFEPQDPATGTNAHECNNAWSGNLLNWVSMTRMDVLRQTLYGGYRSTDANRADLGATVLERAMLPNDTHAFAKVFTAPSRRQLRKFVPTIYAVNTSLSFCNVTNAAGGLSRDTTAAPQIMLAAGAFPRWAMTAAPQCAIGGADRPDTADTLANLNARVVVCAPGKLEENCTAYGTNYKPTGLLQKYGENAALSRVQFGLMTGSYSKNKSGGVLRKNIGLLSGNPDTDSNEINSATGQFINQASNQVGIVNTLNRMRISGWQFGGGGAHMNNCNSPGIASFSDGECVDWGNPLGEMYLESMRYFAGKTAALGAFDSTTAEATHLPALPKVTWADPLPAGDWCAMSSTVVLSTGLNSFDTDQLTAHGIDGLDADTLTKDVGIKEGLSGSYLIGSNSVTTNDQCSAKPLSDLSKASGICPEVPALQGGYHIAGLAYANLNVDLRPGYFSKRDRRWGSSASSPRPGYAARQPMSTYTVSVAESLPKLEIAVGGGTITFLPACMSNSTGGANQDSAGWRVCSLNDMRFVSLTTDTNGRPTAGTIEVSWEDSTWGNDYDMDGIQEIEFSVAGGELVLRSRILRSSAGFALRFGYTLTGSSNDGTRFPLLERGGAFRTVPSDWSPNVSFSAGTSAGKLLESPLWYAAKYGRNEGKTEAETLTEWDKDGDGIPDSYFKVSNPAALSTALGKVFEEAARAEASASAIAANSTRLDTNTHVYQALFRSPAWTSEFRAIPLTADGGIGAIAWEAGAQIPSTHTDRNIKTWNGEAWNNGSGVDFSWGTGGVTGAQKTLLGDNESLLNYLRGDRSLERTSALPSGPYRARASLLGDIVNSDPHFVGAENYGYDLPGSGLGTAAKTAYTSFRTTTKRTRPKAIYVGANDGMLHAINATNSAADGGGSELFTYIPHAVIDRLPELAKLDYQHKYFVDGSANSGDAYIDSAWKTILLGTLGAGGKAVFALDITKVSSSNAFASSNVLWEYTDTDLGHITGRAFVARMNDGNWYAVFGNGYNSTDGKAVLYLVPLDRTVSDLAVHKITVDSSGANGLSEPALVDTDGDRIIDLIYVGDLKGNVWKFDVAGDRDTWKSAYLEGASPAPLFTATSAAGTRQAITSALEIGKAPRGQSGYMIYFGTGKYLGYLDIIDTSAQTVYGILDSGSRITGTPPRSALQEQTFIYEGRRTSADASPVRVASNNATNYTGTDAKRGWYLDLLSPNTPSNLGERVISTPLLRHGRLIVTSIVPSTAACDQGGYSWITELDALYGKRLAYNVFDYTNDRLFNDADSASYDDQENPVSSRKLSEEGLMKSPAIISAGEIEYKVGSGTGGGTVVIDEKGMEGHPRTSWRQLIMD